MRHNSRLITTCFKKKRFRIKPIHTIKPFSIIKPIKLHKLNIYNTNHCLQNKNKKESVDLIDAVKYYIGTPFVAMVTVYFPLYILDKIF
jgi:hypothetical protein